MLGHERGDMCRTCTDAYAFGLMRGEAKEKARRCRVGLLLFMAGCFLGAFLALAALEIRDACMGEFGHSDCNSGL